MLMHRRQGEKMRENVRQGGVGEAGEEGEEGK